MKNKLTAVCAVLMAALSALTLQIFAAGRLGDVNNDGEVTASDARLVLRHSARLESVDERYIARADADANGEINAADARKILRASARLESLYAEYVTDVGDTTADGEIVLPSQISAFLTGSGYYLEGRWTSGGETKEISLAVSGDNMHMQSQFEGKDMGVAVIDGKLYAINATAKTYAVLEEKSLPLFDMTKDDISGLTASLQISDELLDTMTVTKTPYANEEFGEGDCYEVSLASGKVISFYMADGELVGFASVGDGENDAISASIDTFITKIPPTHLNLGYLKQQKITEFVTGLLVS